MTVLDALQFLVVAIICGIAAIILAFSAGPVFVIIGAMRAVADRAGKEPRQ